jgi:signal transduction histidine kinase
MSFRARLLLAMVVATLIPLALFAVGVRSEVGKRLVRQHERRIEALHSVIERGLERENAAIARRLRTLAESMPDDDRLRVSVLHGAGGDRRYLLDYAARAKRLAGLDVLQLHDDGGRILSSGHFRNDFDRLAPELPTALWAMRDRVVLARLRTAEGPVLALVRVDSVRMGGRTFALVGGVHADSALLDRFGAGVDLDVELITPFDTVRPGPTTRASTGAAAREIELRVVDGWSGDVIGAPNARLRIVQRENELAAIQQGVNRWFAAALALVALGTLVLGLWLSARLSRPLARLAQATGSVSLEGPEPELATERRDEIGILARRLSSMTRRLRSGAQQLRDAERRATVGDMARQVNHDIKNGLIPIRNVLRHLTQVQEQNPGELPAIYAARRSTLESSVGYLDELARRYARLTPRVERRAIDLAAIAREVARSASAGGARVECLGNGAIPVVHGDPIALRRIIDNLVRNAVESLTSDDGAVTLHVERVAGGVRLSVSDTGRGMTEAELARAFDDFHTTKPSGTGLGLSVVRRLASDLGATVRIDTAPGQGTTVILDLPGTDASGSARAGRPPIRDFLIP